MSSLSKKVLSLVLGACVVATLFAASMVPASAKVDTEKYTEGFTDSTLEEVLTYTDNNGITTRDDFVISSLDNFGDKKFLTWSDADTTAQAGINQRLNIAKEKGDFKLTSFSFKMPLYATSEQGRYHPAYILFGQDSETTQKAMVVGGNHNTTKIGYQIASIPLAPDSAVAYSDDAWNDAVYTGNLTTENQKVLVTYTVSINWANNTATVGFSKPAADGVEGSYAIASSASKTINLADLQDVYFAVSAGRVESGAVYITDVETTYEYEYVSHDWINEVNPNTADAEQVLSYTSADGQTVMEPVVTNIAGANAVTWNSKSTTGVSGERHQRINIASEKNGAPLTSFSFKSLVVSNGNSATPIYILLGSSADEATQKAVLLGGWKTTGYLSYNTKNIAIPATGDVNGSSPIFNKNTTGTLRTDIENEIGKEYYRFTVKLYGTYAKIIAENLDANGNVEWSGEAQKDIDLSDVANPYFAISSGWAAAANPAYVTDIQPVYAEPEMKGATIRQTASASEQDIMFGSQIRIAESIADGYKPAGYGMLLARTADIKNETQPMTADVVNANVTNLYHEVGEDTDFLYTVTINKSAVAGESGKKFSARAYVKYVKEGAADIYVYSEQIAKSVYGYAKDMAADVITSGNVAASYTLSDNTVFNYDSDNIKAAINGISKDAASFDVAHKNDDHLLAFIYANKDYNKGN